MIIGKQKQQLDIMFHNQLFKLFTEKISFIQDWNLQRNNTKESAKTT